MDQPFLEGVIKEMAEAAAVLSEADLIRPWKWGSYDSEGIRFGFFRVMEELRSLAVRIQHTRQAAGCPPTQAQRILAQHQAAFRDLQATVLGLDETGFTRLPAEGEWPIRTTLAHILEAQLGFTASIRYALERMRANDGRPARIPEDAWGLFIGLREDEYGALMNSPAENLLAFLAGMQARLLAEFGSIKDHELEMASHYWEVESYSLRFRLHRYESHCRQHTIQIEKALYALDRLPSEAIRLMRLIYAALAEVEGALIGAENVGGELAKTTARQIQAWLKEIKQSAGIQ